MNEEGAGSAERLLALIGAHRDSIREALDGEQYALLLSRLTALADVAPDDGRGIRRALQGVRLALLALPLDHPVRLALDSLRMVAAPPGPETVVGAQELTAWLRLPSPTREPAHEPPPEPAHEPPPEPTYATPPEPTHGPASPPPPSGTAPQQPSRTAPQQPSGTAPQPPSGTDPEKAHLLRTPALSAGEARARCGGAPPPELIRLPDARDVDRYPEFQFPAGGGTPYQVVLEVNRLLLAEIDPWGAASWWLSHNTWLGGTPASLLGRLPDQRLVGAAHTLAEGE
ncbi:hypothetical protein GCM10010260_63080 [Streptomyces filipinensis]|uniref:Uncharacterized protein n=1 Tax=Streptomyces filipinensis TaxID=66887 RepID=A0A918MDK7_9ACTN|nr:hypothetical protein [Streptomyces filipinensis]GGV15341.1 hypothetical protein GCM10010260_63080 [Streptomyces filipinensis]